MVKVNIKTAAKILLIVTATFINTACFRTFEKRRDHGNLPIAFKRCLRDISICAPHTFDERLNIRGNTFGTIAPIIDQVCIDYQHADECLRPFKSCQSYEHELQHLCRQFDFYCSDLGKSLLREFQQSACYNNFPKLLDYYPICLSRDSQHSARANSETLGQCVIRLLTADCGEPAGLIVFGAFYKRRG